MDLGSLIFFLIAVVIVYILYILYFRPNSVNEVPGEINLSQSPPAVTTIIKPGSINFTYSLWMYVNQWQTGSAKVIFRSKNASSVFHTLKLGQADPTLTFEVQNDGTAANMESINITSAFPLQKWMHLTICVSGQIMDFYLNGKMVKSVQNRIAPTIDITTIEFGTGFDCYIRKFKRSLETVSQEQVNNDYLAGNGMMGLSSATSLEGRVEILKDSQVQTSVKLF